VAKPKVLVEMHPTCALHDAGAGHPERPARLEAVRKGLELAYQSEYAEPVVPRPATRHELLRVHHPDIVDALEAFCRAGGGMIDMDTGANNMSWDAALVAAGGGLDAIERLRAGQAEAAFVAVRPPGHHATPERAMGFCLLNNVAVAAAALADEGEQVLIVDFDAHHGNGTQDTFFADGRVAYLSLHEWPLYPGTGRITDRGEGEGFETTINLPLPAGTTGDVYLAAIDEVVLPFAERFDPTWLIMSAGFDGHRADPLTDLGLTSGDFGEITSRLRALVPAGRRLMVLEGGYDLQALADSTQACVAALVGERVRPEGLTSGGPGRPVVDKVHQLNAFG
jgi:acetoin utilization deacetylase AcuC-like enzyme